MHKHTQHSDSICRLLSIRYWGLSLVGLAIAVGVVANRSKPVFSNQLDNDPYSYRVILPDSGAYFETWREEASYHITDEVSSAPSGKTLVPSEPMITAIVPKVERPASKSITTPFNYPQKDGIYLYGQSPQPGQLGQGYVVFEKNNGRVVGALYMPDSEYSCFDGTVDSSGELAMTVNGYQGEIGQTQVATSGDTPKMNEDEPTSYAYSLALRDFHAIEKISTVDHQILQACKE
ncbi:MAG: hypothetical protein IGS39_18645 [Calothrix sp. C42_A2020_038]|nr:hypothetical protein [Calothrix sp. C42_A2020_038]